MKTGGWNKETMLPEPTLEQWKIPRSYLVCTPVPTPLLFQGVSTSDLTTYEQISSIAES